jgi:hypothetical protein
MTEGKPLTPLSDGIVLLVGTKASNFDEEIKTHPRVVMWESQNQHWTDKDMPSNTRAVFMTRFIGHAAFKNIVAEARKRHITIFNPIGTGIITRQVRELLSLSTTKPVIKTETIEMKEKSHGKLKVLLPMVDLNKSNIENARALLIKANELNIKTTEDSLANSISTYRLRVTGKLTRPASSKSRPVQSKPTENLDTSVQILDNMIKELRDMREFLVATTNENHALKAKLASLKKALGE